MTVRHLAVPNYTVPSEGGGGSWLFDYTDDADTNPPLSGWTTTGGGDIGIKSGVLCVFTWDNNYDPGYFTYNIYGTEVTGLPTLKAEVLLASSSSEVGYIFFATADMSRRSTVNIVGNGNWGAGYHFGGTDGGTWTPPAFETVITLEVIATATNTCTLKIDGATIKTGVGLIGQTAGDDYVGIFITQGGRFRKLDFTPF